MFRLTYFLFVMSCVLTGGCVISQPDRIHYEWNANNEAPCQDCLSDKVVTRFVGLAFSGGGSRAAVFAAAGAEALHAKGLLDQVTHISSVSGGSFAAAHLTAFPVSDCQRDVPQSKHLDCEAEYFISFKRAMRQNYLFPMELRQLSRPNRFLSPTRRITSLQEVLDKKFLRERTFGQLPASPVLLINAASYDDARRFVFSNQTIPDVDHQQLPLSKKKLRAKSFSLDGCPHSTPNDFPISLAVATSAAFPPVLGPVAIKILPTCNVHHDRYWHLGDGGIIENTGVETLQEIILRLATKINAPKQILIFSFDASKPDIPEEFSADADLRLWTSNPARVVTIANERAEAYRAIVWEQVQRDLDVLITILTFRYTDAKIDEWPKSCPASARRSPVIMAHLQKIPTQLKINDCDADLMEQAAKILVEDILSANEEALVEAGLIAATMIN